MTPKVLRTSISLVNREFDPVEAKGATRAFVSADRLSSLFVSFEGYEVDLLASHWVLSRDVTVRLGWIKTDLSPSMQDSALLVLKDYAINGSAAHVSNIVDRFLGGFNYEVHHG